MKTGLLFLPLLFSTVLPLTAIEQVPQNTEQTYQQIEQAIELVNPTALKQLLSKVNMPLSLKMHCVTLAKAKHNELGRQFVSLQRNSLTTSGLIVPVSILGTAAGIYLGFLPGRLIGWNRLADWDQTGFFELWAFTVGSILAGSVTGFQYAKKFTRSLSVDNEFEKQQLQAKVNDATTNIQLLESLYL